MSNDGTASGAQGEANADFAVASGRARQEQIGNVGAGDQVDEKNGSHQEQGQSPSFLRHFVTKRPHSYTRPGIGVRMLSRDSRRYRLQLGPGLRQRDSVFQFTDAKKE